MLICSQLPKIHFCKELSPVPAKGAVPIPAPLGWGWSQVTLACCTQRVSVGYKPLATAAFPSAALAKKGTATFLSHGR